MNNNLRTIIFGTILLAILGGGASYLVADGYYHSRIGELVAQATHDAQGDADDLSDSIRRNLHYLSGIPDFLSRGLRVQTAVTHVYRGEAPSALSYEVKKSRWMKSPVLQDLNRTLAHAQASLNADLIYVINADGDSIAASNWDTPGSPIGTNYAERDYFSKNRAGQRGMQYAVGKTTHVAGLFFSAPVFINGKFMGAVVAKVDVPKLSFLTKLTDAFVTDRNGVIILAHDRPLEMKVLPNGALRGLPQQDIINHYQRSDFQTLRIEPWAKGEFASVQRIEGEANPHILANRELPEYGLTVHVESELPAMVALERQRSWVPVWIGLTVFLLILIVGIAVYYFQVIRRAKGELSKSERSYRELMEQAADAIFVSDHEGRRFQDVNHAACEMLGYTRAELLNMGVRDLLDPEDVVSDPIRLAEMYAGKIIHMQRRYRRRDGKYISADLRARMLGDGRLQEIVRDISARRAIEEAVRKREQQYHAVIETSEEGFWMINMQGRLLEVNTSYQRQSGYSRRELLAMSVPELEAEHPGDTAARISKITRDGHDRFETRHRRKDGSIWPVEVVTTHWREGNLIFAFLTDVSERKQAEERAQLAGKIYQASNEAIMVTDESNRIVEINPAFTRITGYTLEEVAGRNPSILKSGKHDGEFYRGMWQSILHESSWQGEIWDRRKDGMLYAKWATISVLRHADGSVYRHVAQFSDITEKKQKDELIQRQASYDALTGLPNRRLFRDRLEVEIKKVDNNRAGLPLALLYLDLDRFKEINDTLGHARGDVLLVEAARRIGKCVRETDTVARLGGDEFTVILPEVGDPSQPERIARSIIGELVKPFDLGDGHIGYVSASIGITLYPDDARDYEELVKYADQAMYAAKGLGRNCHSYFTASMQQGAREKLALTNDLRQALARKELHVYYQPILELGSGRITKAEALLRWKHPARGMVSPAVFIPLAEESGLIHEIGDWVFQQAIAQVAEWRKVFGSVIQVSVNKSPVQFEQPGGCTWAVQMKKLGLPGNGITVEITEGLLFKESAKAKEQLLEFRNHGIEVSIDDFGTGFSSLSYLKQFDIDYVKIDRSFVKDLEVDQDDKALTEAIIVMAHKLGIKTIAEGVETEAQRDLLASFGCDYVQGFLYSPAVPAEEFSNLLTGKMFEQEPEAPLSTA